MKRFVQAHANKTWTVLEVEDKDAVRAEIVLMYCPKMKPEEALQLAGISYREKPYRQRRERRKAYFDDGQKIKSS